MSGDGEGDGRKGRRRECIVGEEREDMDIDISPFGRLTSASASCNLPRALLK